MFSCFCSSFSLKQIVRIVTTMTRVWQSMSACACRRVEFRKKMKVPLTGSEMVHGNRATFIIGRRRKGNMETDCEESWLTFPVAGMNFHYEFSFSSNFHEIAAKGPLPPLLPPLLSSPFQAFDVAWMLIVQPTPCGEISSRKRLAFINIHRELFVRSPS